MTAEATLGLPKRVQKEEELRQGYSADTWIKLRLLAINQGLNPATALLNLPGFVLHWVLNKAVEEGAVEGALLDIPFADDPHDSAKLTKSLKDFTQRLAAAYCDGQVMRPTDREGINLADFDRMTAKMSGPTQGDTMTMSTPPMPPAPPPNGTTETPKTRRGSKAAAPQAPATQPGPPSPPPSVAAPTVAAPMALVPALPSTAPPAAAPAMRMPTAPAPIAPKGPPPLPLGQAAPQVPASVATPPLMGRPAAPAPAPAMVAPVLSTEQVNELLTAATAALGTSEMVVQLGEAVQRLEAGVEELKQQNAVLTYTVQLQEILISLFFRNCVTHPDGTLHAGVDGNLLNAKATLTEWGFSFPT